MIKIVDIINVHASAPADSLVANPRATFDLANPFWILYFILMGFIVGMMLFIIIKKGVKKHD